MRRWNTWEHLWGDVRFAVRQLARNPGFAVTATLILALGMGASLAIFAFVDAALLKPLPYEKPGQLMAVYSKAPMFPLNNLSYPDYLDWKRLNRAFKSLDIFQGRGFLLQTAEGLEPARGARVSDGFFRTLGVKPALGRDFYAGEDQPGAPRTVMLSFAAWQRRYGGKPTIIGQTVTLDARPMVVVGVLPADFHFALVNSADYWTVFRAESNCDLRRSCRGIYGVGRLKEGVSAQAALADLTIVAQQLERQYAEANRGIGAAIAPLSEAMVGNIEPILLTLLAGAGLLLAIAYINVTGLLLVRSASRQREIAVRRAMGASAGRLMTQFVAEAAVLTGAGTLLGLAAAHWTSQVLVTLISEEMLLRMPFLTGLGLNGRVVAAAGAISLLAVAICALAPSWRLGSPAVRDGLAEGSRGSAGVVWRRVGSKLVVVELATAMVLLVAAGLLGKSLYRLLKVETGLRAEQLVMMNATTPSSSRQTPEEQIATARRIVSAIEKLPGVTSVGVVANGTPIGGNGNTTWFRVLGRPWNGEHSEAPERDVSPEYFTTIGARLLRGRSFTEAEDASKPAVAIVNEAFVRQYFPNEEPLGKQVSYLSTPPKPIEIVGVVADIREGPLDAEIPPVLYMPFNQSPDRFLGLAVRTTQAEAALLPAMAKVVREVNPAMVTMDGTTMTERIRKSPSAALHRSSAWLVGGFAALALVLGLVGLYGVVSYSVSQRTREIGVRMALGAERGSVYRIILGEAGWLTAAGVGAGLVLAVGAARMIEGLLFGVESWDFPTLAGVAAGLGVAALVASLVPARRAASINPVEALRAE